MQESTLNCVVTVLKIFENYISNNLRRSIDALPHMELYNLLVYYFFDDSPKLSQIYAQILSNFLAMTGHPEGEKRIQDDFFSECLSILNRGKYSLIRSHSSPADELPGVSNTR